MSVQLLGKTFGGLAMAELHLGGGSDEERILVDGVRKGWWFAGSLDQPQ